MMGLKYAAPPDFIFTVIEESLLNQIEKTETVELTEIDPRYGKIL